MSVENPNWLSAFGLLQLQVAPIVVRGSGILGVERVAQGSYRVILAEKLTYDPANDIIDGVARPSMVILPSVGAYATALIYTPLAAFPGDVQILLRDAAGALVDDGTVYLTCNRFPTQH